MIATLENQPIVLIGMPGVGKSTLGVLLAKSLGKPFVDTDILLQTFLGSTLQAYLDQYGYMALREKEEELILAQKFTNEIVSTGGSAVYSGLAMQHLMRNARCIYLHISESVFLKRALSFNARGIAVPGSMSIEALYEERSPLYEKYSDLRCDLDGLGIEASLKKLITQLNTI